MERLCPQYSATIAMKVRSLDRARSKTAVNDWTQFSMRHLMPGDLFLRRAVPSTFAQIGPQRAYRRRCRNLRCTKPRGTSPGYGYLIQLVAAQLRGSKKRTQRASLGTTANWTFCKLRGLLIGDFVASKPQHGTTWAERGRRHDDGLGSSRWVGGKRSRTTPMHFMSAATPS